jgi:hypothetical protein
MAALKSPPWIRFAGIAAMAFGALLVAISVGACPLRLFGFVAWVNGARGGAIVTLSVVVAAMLSIAIAFRSLGWTSTDDAAEDRCQRRELYRRVPRLRTFVRVVVAVQVVGFVALCLSSWSEWSSRFDGHLTFSGLWSFFTGLWFAWVFPQAAANPFAGTSSKLHSAVE